MKILISFFLFLFLSTGLSSETIFLHGKLSLCQESGEIIKLALTSVTYEPQSFSEQSQLQQALAKRYRQNGALQVHIVSEEIAKQPELQQGCLIKSSPFSMALPRLGVLKIKAEVEPETLEITWVQWLENPALSVEVALPTFESPKPLVFSQLSKTSLEAVSEPLSPKAEPEAYPPGGTGYGSVTFDNGDSYTGYFKSYRFDGKGTYRWKNGNTHDGYWSAGQRHGSGTWIRVGLGRWVGNWVRDSLEGYGQIFFNNGEKYEGNFSNWQAHGYGKWSWPNGQYYEGSFLYGYFSGLGTMVLANGTKYVGNWVQSKRNGYGVETYPNGDSYSGSWTNDHYHGQGKYTGKDWWYEGNFADSLRHGLGTQEEEKRRYEGLWERDQIHGRGKLTDKIEGTIWETSWIQGDLGREYSGIITTREGHRFEGVFKGLLPHQGRVLFSNQDTYEGPFVNGMFHGRGKYTFFQEGITIEDEFKEDSCLLSLEETLSRLGITPEDGSVFIPPTVKKESSEIKAAFSIEDNRNPGLLLFLTEAGAIGGAGYLTVNKVRFITFTAAFAAAVVLQKTSTGMGIIYYREDRKKLEPDLFLYVGKTKDPLNYKCRKYRHNHVYKKLFPAHEEFRFEEFEVGINTLDPIFEVKEQAYMQLCDNGETFWCAPHGPGHLANKINGMGMKGFKEWKAENPLEWAMLEVTCGIP